jgi:hypothetical protein
VATSPPSYRSNIKDLRTHLDAFIQEKAIPENSVLNLLYEYTQREMLHDLNEIQMLSKVVVFPLTTLVLSFPSTKIAKRFAAFLSW